MERNDLVELFNKMIDQRTKYLRFYVGKVLDTNDPLKKGRVLVAIPDLGWNTNQEGAWAWPTKINSAVTPKVDESVRVGFMNGRPEKPFFLGLANEIEEMLPVDFDGLDTTNIIYQSKDDDTRIKYDESAKEFTYEDSHGNIEVKNSTGVQREDANGNKETTDSSGIVIEDLNTNSIEMSATGISIKNTTHTLDLLSASLDISGVLLNIFGATESYVKGNTFDTWLTTSIITYNTHAHAGVTSGPSSTAVPSATITPPVNYLSSKIKGE